MYQLRKSLIYITHPSSGLLSANNAHVIEVNTHTNLWRTKANNTHAIGVGLHLNSGWKKSPAPLACWALTMHMQLMLTIAPQ